MQQIAVKLLVIGDSGVGKTNILLRFTQDHFESTHIMTIGVDYKVKRLQVDDKLVTANVWDTAGQQRFKHIIKNFFKGCQGILVCFSLSDAKSLQHVEGWLDQVTDSAGEGVQLVLVGNKSDISKREVGEEQVKALTEKHQIEYFETSAKLGEGVNQAFGRLIRKVIQSPAGRGPGKGTKGSPLGGKGGQRRRNCC